MNRLQLAQHRRDEAERLFAEGQTTTEVAEALGVSIAWASEYLRRNAVSIEYFCKCCTAGIVRFQGEQKSSECDECGQTFARNIFDQFIPSKSSAIRRASHYTESEYKACPQGLGCQLTGKRGKE